MKKILLICTLLMSAAGAQAQSNYGLNFSSLVSDNLTLESAIRLGLENNSEFLTAQQEIAIAEQKVSEAKFRYLPQFALQGTASWYDAQTPMILTDGMANRYLPATNTLDNDRFYGVGVSATQYIYSGGRISSALKTARANLKQVQSRYATVKNATVLDIKKSFVRLLYAQKNVDLTEQVYKSTRRWLLSDNVWTKIRQKALLSHLQAQRNEAQSELAKARLGMLASLNKETNAPLTIAGNLEPVWVTGDAAHFQLWATEFRPELKSAIYALELDNIAIDLAISKRYPDILLNASYERVGDNSLEDQNKQISLAVRLPIPYTFSQQVNQKKAEQKKSTLRRAAMEDKVHLQVAASFEQMMFWQQEVLARQKTYQELDEIIQPALKTSGRAGIGPLEALQAYLKAGQDYLQALRENHIAKAELEWAIGKDL